MSAGEWWKKTSRLKIQFAMGGEMRDEWRTVNVLWLSLWTHWLMLCFFSLKGIRWEGPEFAWMFSPQFNHCAFRWNEAAGLIVFSTCLNLSNLRLFFFLLLFGFLHCVWPPVRLCVHLILGTCTQPWAFNSPSRQEHYHTPITNPRGMKRRHFDVCQRTLLQYLEERPRITYKP